MINYDFQKYEQDARAFLKEVAQEVGDPDDLAHAGRVLNAVLHTLRERITPHESMDLISQLPLYIKAAYIEGWHLSDHVNRLKTKEEFLAAVQRQVPRTAGRDFGSAENTQKNVAGVMRVIRKHISPGELEDVKAQLPQPIVELMEI